MSAPGADPLAAIRQRHARYAATSDATGFVTQGHADMDAILKQWDTRESALRAQVETLTGIVRDTLWMAGRYADRRMSYAVGLYNDARVKAEALGCADGATIAIDGMDPEMPTWAERITDLRASLAAVEGERDRLKHENQWAGHHPWCAAWKLHRSGPGLVPMGAMRSESCDCGWETARSGVGSPVDPDRIKRMQDEVIVLTADRDLWKGICRNRDGAHAGQITELRASLATGSKSWSQWLSVQAFLLANPDKTAAIVTPQGTFTLTLKPTAPTQETTK